MGTPDQLQAVAAPAACELVAVVDAPTGLTANLLALRLPRYRCRTTQGLDRHWRVFVDLVSYDRLPVLIAAVETWLARERIATTRLRVGEVVHDVTADDPAQRPRARPA